MSYLALKDQGQPPAVRFYDVTFDVVVEAKDVPVLICDDGKPMTEAEIIEAAKLSFIEDCRPSRPRIEFTNFRIVEA